MIAEPLDETTARRVAVLRAMSDDWRQTGRDFRPSAGPFAPLHAAGLAEAKRARPFPSSVLRWYVRRTPAGRELVERVGA